MKHLTIAMVAVLASHLLVAQPMGIGTNAPNPSALLEVSSSSKGMLLPRMTTTQRNAIATPAKGLLVYDTDAKALFHYNGSQWVAASGDNLGLPYSANVSLPGAAFNISNTGTAIQATSSATSAIAISGSSNAIGSYGVFGVNNSPGGYGAAGITEEGVAVAGFSSGSGTALRGVSTSGYALTSNGNIRLTGGNTNPTTGAVLTATDNQGNAVWKPRQVAFKVSGVAAAYQTFPDNGFTEVRFANKEYDYGDGAIISDAIPPSSFAYFYTVPVSGLYHFDMSIRLTLPNGSDKLLRMMGQLTAIKQSSGTTSNLAFFSTHYDNQGPENQLRGSCNVKLQAGDKLRFLIAIDKQAAANPTATAEAKLNYISGHLVKAD